MKLSFLSSASLYIVGSFFGSLVAGVQIRYCGRKFTMQTANIVILCGFLASRFGYNVSLLYIGRVLIGYSNGLWQQCAPVYTGEINQAKIRKITGSFFVVSFTFGFALIYTLGSFCYWRDALNYIAIWPILNFIFLFACPESPTWLVNKGRSQEAKCMIEKIRMNDRVAKLEIARMEKNKKAQELRCQEDKDRSYIANTLNVIGRGTFIRPFLVLTFILSFSIQWSGAPAMGLYLVDILKGFKVPFDPYSTAAIVTIYRLMIVIIGTVLTYFVPRRPFYLVCNVLVASGTLVLGTSGYLHSTSDFINLEQENNFLNWMPMVGVLLFYTGLSAGLVSVGFILFGELLPSNARDIGTTLVSTFINVSFFASTKSVPYLREVLGLHGLFYLYSSVACISIIFGYLSIPETFGKTLEDIEDHYRKVCYGSQIKICVTDPDNNSQIVDSTDDFVLNRTRTKHERSSTKFRSSPNLSNTRRASAHSMISLT